MDIAEKGQYHALSVQTGSALSRAENRIALKGEDVDLTMTTLYLANNKQVMDVTTLVDHQMPNCTSRQIVRGVLDDQAKGIFQGKVIVARDAQKTDGNQMSRTLLLSRKCEADAKPELEIYADDVACSHGATVGEIDDNHLFYLMSRGISKTDARQMLIEAFLADVLDDIDNDVLKAPVEASVAAWLSALGAVMTNSASMVSEMATEMDGGKRDIATIRDDFPILKRQVHDKPLVYLDSAASSQKPQYVLDALMAAYSQHYSNVHRGLHMLSEESTDAYEATRGKVARLINAPSDDEIVFTSGATMALNLIARSWGGANLKPGDEIPHFSC